MKTICSLLTVAAFTCSVFTACGQEDKTKRPSPPAKVSVTTTKGATIKIDYNQPSVKGRTIGKEIAKYGEVWRTGANEATVFETNKDVMVNGVNVKAGKYGLFTIPGENEWTFILNKKSDLWGADGYSQTEDVVRIPAKPHKAPVFTEKMTFAADPSGKIALMWGDVMVDFKVD